jgi:prepilin signal peptidase PulO-like enzyme (type II secretory pathway)
MAVLDAAFASHTALTLAHILPALFFVLISPWVVFQRFAGSVWAESMVYPLGAVVALTAYAMSMYAVGGWIEQSAVLFFNSLFLFSLCRSYWHRNHGQPVLKRRWMLRAVVILLGIATTRPVMGVFFATSALTHLAPSQFFGIAFWIGFSINTFAVELWLRVNDRKSQTVNDLDQSGR